jgi:hypothetical protein
MALQPGVGLGLHYNTSPNLSQLSVILVRNTNDGWRFDCNAVYAHIALVRQYFRKEATCMTKKAGAWLTMGESCGGQGMRIPSNGIMGIKCKY